MLDINVNDSYETLVELGEKVFFFERGVERYASFTPNRLNKAIATTDGAYWFNGNMTFESMYEQEHFNGEYFQRESQPNAVMMLYGVFPCPYDERIADIHCVECNEVVDIVSHYEDTGKRNELGEPIYEPVYVAQGVNAYVTMFTKDARTAVVGNLEETITYITFPAKYTISNKNTIMKDTWVFNEDEGHNEIKKMPYQIESIDSSMMDVIDKEIVGTIKCMIKEKQ